MSSGLMDSVLPQSTINSNFINRQINSRLFKDLENMSDKLSIGNKNKLLRESNDDDYDILIDDKIFEEEDEG